ncbi:MAG: hypothetical protein WC563_15600 [Brevundimonas sp.]
MESLQDLDALLSLVGQSFSTLRDRSEERDPGPADRRDRFVVECCDDEREEVGL